MDLSKYNNLPEGVDKIEDRDIVFYNKYEYRANVHLKGIRRTYFCDTPRDLDERINDLVTSTPTWYNDHAYIKRMREEAKTYDMQALYAWINWRHSAGKSVMVRIEGDKAAVFSNDLAFLHTLDQVAPGNVQYTQARTGVRVAGIKYFARQPKHNYRIYLKGREAKEESKKLIREFLQFYKKQARGKKPIIEASSSLESVIKDRDGFNVKWLHGWFQTHHYIDYDDEKLLTMMVLKFGELLGKGYKLEKRELPTE
jgi:hypothetical protein